MCVPFIPFQFQENSKLRGSSSAIAKAIESLRGVVFDSAAGINDDALILEADFEQVENKKKPSKKPTMKPRNSRQKKSVCASGMRKNRMEKDYCTCMNQQCCSSGSGKKFEKHDEVCKSCGFGDKDEGLPWDEDLMELSDCNAEFGDDICDVKCRGGLDFFQEE